VRGFLAGAAAGVVSSGVMRTLARLLSVDVDREAMLGTFLGGRPDRAHLLLGFGIHLLISGAFGVGYDAGFARLRSSDVKTGVLLSPAHFLVSGTFFAALDRLHPLVPGTFRDPGPFFTRFGVRGVALLLATKIAFGASVAALEQRFA
jgi:hypothetical protein